MHTYKSCDRPITGKLQLLYLFTLPSYPRTSLYRRAYPHDCQVNICTNCRTYRYYLNRNRYLTIIIPALHGTLLVRHDSPHYISKRIHTLTNILFQPYTPPSAMLRTTPGTVQRKKRAIARAIQIVTIPSFSYNRNAAHSIVIPTQSSSEDIKLPFRAYIYRFDVIVSV